MHITGVTMYLQNKYTRTYYAIINKAKSRNLTTRKQAKEVLGYPELHHIIPTCLNGDNSKENTVFLTAHEHFVCHLLLTKMLVGKEKSKMVFALSMITKIKNIGSGRYIPSGRLYEYARKLFKDELLAYWTEERRKIHAEKISKVTKGRKTSEETKEKLRNKEWTDKAIQNRLSNCLTAAASRKGTVWSNEMRQARDNTYFDKNLELASKVFDIMKTTTSINAIAKYLDVDWITVKTIIIRQEEFKERINLSGKKL